MNEQKDPLTPTERALWTIIAVLDHHGWPWRTVYAMKDHIDLIASIEKKWNDNRLKLQGQRGVIALTGRKASNDRADRS